LRPGLIAIRARHLATLTAARIENRGVSFRAADEQKSRDHHITQPAANSAVMSFWKASCPLPDSSATFVSSGPNLDIGGNLRHVAKHPRQNIQAWVPKSPKPRPPACLGSATNAHSCQTTRRASHVWQLDPRTRVMRPKCLWHCSLRKKQPGIVRMK